MAGGRYRAIHSSMWGDAKFMRLSGMKASGQSLWIFLIAGPHTSSLPGIFAEPLNAMAGRLGWSRPAFRKALAEITAQGMVEVDEQAGVWWIPGGLEYARPRSPSNVTPWWADIAALPESALAVRAVRALRAHCIERDEEREKNPPKSKPKNRDGTEKRTDPRKESFLLAFNDALQRGCGQTFEEWEACMLSAVATEGGHGPTDASANGQTDGPASGQTIGSTLGRTLGQALGSTIGQTDGRTPTYTSTPTCDEKGSPSGEPKEPAPSAVSASLSEEGGEESSAEAPEAATTNGQLFEEGQQPEASPQPPERRITADDIQASRGLREGESGAAIGRRVFLAWAEARGEGLWKWLWNEKRANLIRTRLKEGHKEEHLLEAAAGVAVDSWHRQNGHISFEIVFRSTETIERFQGYARGDGPEGGPNLSATEERDRRRREASRLAVDRTAAGRPRVERRPGEMESDYRKRVRQAEVDAIIASEASYAPRPQPEARRSAELEGSSR